MSLPKMIAVRQSFEREREPDIKEAVQRELARLSSGLTVRRGARVGVSVGSRGICNLSTIARELVDGLKAMGAEPFLFAAMGSHAGGTAEGQAAILEHYGITEKTMRCPVLSRMETVQIGESREGIPVFLDKHAFEADHVVAMNRVKQHTEFKGEIESGIMKMLLIGMGKHQGARVYHRAFEDYGFDGIVESLASVVIERAKVLFGLAILENGYEETARIRGLMPGEIVEGEKKLLRRAKELAPRLPFDDIDVLVVDEMGKNISGTGMDTNVIGRFTKREGVENKPRIKRVYVRELTEESLGNATGIGLAEFAHRRLIDSMDVAATNTNCLTGGSPEKARIPIVCESDREALQFALSTVGLGGEKNPRLVRIGNTLQLAEIEISEPLARSLNGHDLEVVSDPISIEFDKEGNLPPMISAGSHGRSA